MHAKERNEGESKRIEKDNGNKKTEKDFSVGKILFEPSIRSTFHFRQ